MGQPLPATPLQRQRSWWEHPTLVLVLMGLVLLVVVAIRWRLREFPLERDEGEYAYMGRLLLEGVAPYGEAANMKWPGTYLAYAAIMAVFGQTIAGIHLGLLLVTLGSSALLFILARRVTGVVGGVVGGAAAVATHAVLAIGVPTLGLAAHATHFVVLFSLGGLVVLTTPTRLGWKRVLAAGVLFGFATLMKQAGAAFGVLAASWLIWRGVVQSEGPRNWRGLALQLGALSVGALLPLAVSALWLWRAGVWPQFWFWTVQYAKSYASFVTLADGLHLLGLRMVLLLKAAPGLWLAMAVGLVALFGWRALRPWRFFVLGFLGLSMAAVCPGWFFREHYFLLLLPAVALLAGIATAGLTAAVQRWPVTVLPGVLLVFAAAQALWVGRAVFFQLTPVQACRVIYGPNPFPESVEIARYLREHTGPQSKIVVVGSEPQIYFYAQRRAATPYLYVYPLMEPQPYAEQMHREFIQRVEQADPDYLVYVNIPFSWCVWPDARTDVLEWAGGYQSRRFTLVGFADMLSADRTDYRWLDQFDSSRPQSPLWVAVFRNNRLASP